MNLRRLLDLALIGSIVAIPLTFSGCSNPDDSQDRIDPDSQTITVEDFTSSDTLIVAYRQGDSTVIKPLHEIWPKLMSGIEWVKNDSFPVEIKMRTDYQYTDSEDRGNLSPQKPDFGVRSKEAIVPGETFLAHSEHSPTLKIQVTKGPFKEDRYGLQFKYKVLDGPEMYQGNIKSSYLADAGVVAYSHGTWNTGNWLERIE